MRACKARHLGAILTALPLAAAVAAGGCSAQFVQPTHSEGPDSSTDDTTGPLGTRRAGDAGDSTGALGLQLVLPGSEHFSLLTYSLTNGAHVLSGSFNISTSGVLSFVIGNVPSGTGYALSLSTVSDDGNVVCAFPAPGDPAISNITVSGKATTIESVNLQCLNAAGLDGGALIIAGIASFCPRWIAIVASPAGGGDGGATVYPTDATAPASVGVGQSVVLVASATAPNPSQLSFNWTASAGSLASSTGTITPGLNDAGASDQTTFTCPSTPGSVVVSLVVADGPVPEGGGCDPAFTQGSITVNCQPGASCDGGATCSDAGGGDAGAEGGAGDDGGAEGAVGEAGGAEGGLADGGAADAALGDDGGDDGGGDGGMVDAGAPDGGAGADGGAPGSDAAGDVAGGDDGSGGGEASAESGDDGGDATLGSGPDSGDDGGGGGEGAAAADGDDGAAAGDGDDGGG